MSSLYKFPVFQRKNGEPPHNGDMEARLVRIETQLENIEGTMSTKAEMHDMTAQMIKWVVGTAIGLGVAGITVMTFVLNNASPKTPPAPQQPIVITIPAQSTPPASK